VVDDIVANDTNKVYRCTTAGTSDASGGPTGTTADITDNTAVWAYYGTVPRNLTSYSYQSVLPPDCLKIRKIPLYGATSEKTQGVQYLREGNWLYCDQDDSTLVYTRRETDPERWDVLCQEVVAMKIATDIAFDVTGKMDLAQLAYQKWQAALYRGTAMAMEEGSEADEEPVRWEDQA
jgi:hypothetical protein